MLQTYCTKCHNSEDWAGGVAFDTMNADSAGEDAKIWEEAVIKLRGGLMPPPGKTQPDPAARQAFIHAAEDFLDQYGAQHPDPGHMVLHRLNRNEYSNAIADLLGVTVDPNALLPRDDKSGNFDNIAEVLKVSPTFLDQYFSAARQVTVAAIGSPHARTQDIFLQRTAGAAGIPVHACRRIAAGHPRRHAVHAIPFRPTASTASPSMAWSVRATCGVNSTPIP